MKGIKISLKNRKTKSENICCEQDKKLQGDEKQRLAEYRKKYNIWKNKKVSQRIDCFWLALLLVY